MEAFLLDPDENVLNNFYRETDKLSEHYSNKIFSTNIKHFVFCDNTINGNIKSLDELCDLIIYNRQRSIFRKDIFDQEIE